MNPDPIGHPQFRPQHPIRGEDLRRIAEQARQAGVYTGTADADVGGGVGVAFPEDGMPPGFWARLTTPAQSGTVALYSFCEVQDDGTGSAWTPPNAGLRLSLCAYEINNNASLSVPGPPLSLSASLATGGTLTSGTYYYVVTATWTDSSGNTHQSDFSNEVTETPAGGTNKVVLTWTAPAAAQGFTVTGYSIWRGTNPSYATTASTGGINPLGENLLVTTVSGSTLTFTDDGSHAGTSQTPVLGGTAGPIVWMSPLAVQNFYKFDRPAVLSFSGAQLNVSAGTTFAVSSGSFVRVSTSYFNSTVFDTNNYAAHVLTGLLNTHANGVTFLLTCNVRFDANNTGERILQIRDQGGLNTIASTSVQAVQGDVTDMMVSTIFYTGTPSANISLDPYVFQDSGGSLNLICTGTSGDLIPSFSLVLLWALFLLTYP